MNDHDSSFQIGRGELAAVQRRTIDCRRIAGLSIRRASCVRAIGGFVLLPLALGVLLRFEECLRVSRAAFCRFLDDLPGMNLVTTDVMGRRDFCHRDQRRPVTLQGGRHKQPECCVNVVMIFR